MSLFYSLSDDDTESPGTVAVSGCAERLSSFPFPSPLLRYSYPPPSADTLARICAALRSTPRFYTQVLHLMNKLSLPAPFASSSVRPPVSQAAAEVPAAPELPRPPTPAERRDAESQTEPADSESDSAESEWASDGESAAARPPAKRRRRTGRLPDSARRLRAARLQRRADAAPAVPAVPLSEVFEERVTVAPARKPVLKLPTETPAPQPATNGAAAPPAAEGGFAKLYPVRPATEGRSPDREREEEDSEFITDRQLAENRLSAEGRETSQENSLSAEGKESSHK